MARYLSLVLGAIIFTGSWTLAFAQTDSDPRQEEVQNRIDDINKLIEEKGYRWRAGITSKSYLSLEEMKALCGLNIDSLEAIKISEKHDSMFSEYKARDASGLLKTLTVPDWKSLMSPIENQECQNCWAHAATGVAEGVLHYRYGSNFGIDQDEMDITNNASCGNCNGTTWLPCGLDYIDDHKVRSEQGLKQFPNYDHGYWTITTYTSNPTGISAIKSSLQNSPVLAGMDVYQDFVDYPGGIYEHASGPFLGYHAIVIVGFNDTEQYWECKNSWGSGWGEDGYFRIAYGEVNIESHGNITSTVTHNSCYAKLISGLMNLDEAISYWFMSNE